jgi:hypothetical protein
MSKEQDINDKEKQVETRFGFAHDQAFLVDNQKIECWWMSPCLNYLIVKVKDDDMFTDDFNYYVKKISEGKEAHKTHKNDMCEILGMNDLNESGLVFLS